MKKNYFFIIFFCFFLIGSFFVKKVPIEVDPKVEELLCSKKLHYYLTIDCRRFIFEKDGDITLNLVMSPDVVDDFKNFPKKYSKIYAPAELSYNGNSFGIIGFRHQSGQKDYFSSSGLAVTPYELKINHFQKQKFYQMKKLILKPISDYEYILSELSTLSVFEKLGVFSPRVKIVKLVLNNAPLGYFLLSEPVDNFMIKRFTHTDGELIGSEEIAKGGMNLREKVPAEYYSKYMLASLLTGDQDGYMNEHNYAMYSYHGDNRPIPETAAGGFQSQCIWYESLTRGEITNHQSAYALNYMIKKFNAMTIEERKELLKIIENTGINNRENLEGKTNTNLQMVMSENFEKYKELLRIQGYFSVPNYERGFSNYSAEYLKQAKCGVDLLRFFLKNGTEPIHLKFHDLYWDVRN